MNQIVSTCMYRYVQEKETWYIIQVVGKYHRENA
jgi:hypothetical protein